MSNKSDVDYERGKELFEKFVRGDAMIGLVADVPAMEREMLDALWTAAGRGSSDAYRVLGDCYLAALQPAGAFDGVAADDAKSRSWSTEAQTIVSEELPSLEAALRAYFEAAGLGDRKATMQFARMSRHADATAQTRAVALLEAIKEPTAAEVYQLGLVQNWLGELEASAKTHHLAADRGDVDAQFELYVYYAQGLGVTKDAKASEAWLERAAEGGQSRALYNLGAAWASGAKGEPDMTKAAGFYERAAERGNGRAATMLAVMILQGDIDGTEERAIAWLDRAAEVGFEVWDILDAAGLEDPRER